MMVFLRFHRFPIYSGFNKLLGCFMGFYRVVECLNNVGCVWIFLWFVSGMIGYTRVAISWVV